MIDLVFNFMGVAWQWLCDFMMPHGTGGQTYAIAPVIAAAAISAAASIANGIFGSQSASKQQKEQLAAIERQRQETKTWRDRIMNEDATQRADANRLLTRMDNAAKKQNLAAAGKQAVMGGTGAVEAATQEANAEKRAEVVSDIYSKQTDRKDKADQVNMQTQSNLTQQEANVKAAAETAKRNAMGQAASGVVNSAASVVGASGDSGSSNNSGSIFKQAKAAQGTTPNNTLGKIVKENLSVPKTTTTTTVKPLSSYSISTDPSDMAMKFLYGKYAKK